MGRSPRNRRLLCEPLESRQLLSASPEFSLFDASPAAPAVGEFLWSASTIDGSKAFTSGSRWGSGTVATVAAEGEAAAEGESGVLETTPSATLTGLSNPWAMAFDSSGNLYVTNFNANTVSKFAPGSTTPSATLTGVNQPRALAFDSSGNLYVVNATGAGTVSKFAPGATTPIATLTGLAQPQSLAFDGDGNLYVANDVAAGTVSKFAPGSTTPSATLLGLNHPIALAFDHSGNLYAASYDGNTVHQFAPGSTTPSDGYLSVNRPSALAFDAAGNLYVASLTGGTVSRFAPGSTTANATYSGLIGPSALAFDAAGSLYVANYQGNTISRFAPGNVTPSNTLTGLNAPANLAFDAAGSLYVTNFQGSTVSAFSPPGLAPVATATLSGTPTDRVRDLRISWSAVPWATSTLTSLSLGGTSLTSFAIRKSATSVVVPSLAFSATASLPLSVGLTTSGLLSETKLQLQVTGDQAGGSPNPWRNYPVVLDVNADQNLTSKDALVIINYINANGLGPLPATLPSPAVYLDVDGNRAATPLDVLRVINCINQQSTASGEGEATSIKQAFSLAPATLTLDPRTGPASIGAVLTLAASLPVADRPARPATDNAVESLWDQLPDQRPLPAVAEEPFVAVSDVDVDEILPDIVLDVLGGWSVPPPE